MQPVRKFDQTLSKLADKEHFLFSLSDLRGINPQQTKGAFKVMIIRAVQNGLLNSSASAEGSIFTQGFLLNQVLLYLSAAKLVKKVA